MENPGSSIISAFGAGSGVNFIQLADQLSDATFAFQRSSLETRNQGLEARISSASLLRNALTQLSSALGDRVRNGELSPRANVANPAVVDVTTTSGVVPRGSYSLEVSQLADSQLLISQPYASGDDLVGEGSLRIRFGEMAGASFTEDTGQDALDIAVDATDTVETLAAKISAASEGSLQAYVAQGTGGAQLVIKGSDGATNGFVIEATSTAPTPSATPGDLTYLAWQPTTDAGQLRQSAADALYTLDTVQYASNSNTVTGLPEGLSFDLKGTNVGAPTTISFSNDTSAITDVMNDFLVALNDLAALLAEEATPLGGALGNDPAARELRRDLARLTSEIVMPSAGPGEPSTLADLGLKTTREGRFELDTERLNETLAASPQAAAAMFTTGPFGLFATIDRLTRDNTTRSDPGSLSGSVLRYEAQVERNSEKLDRIAEQQENLRERLTRDLVAAERRISASQSTLSFLEQQIEAWNGSN
ncbi:flagellar hook protein [Erythrobacter sp. KY5]|uniref:flagellar filament capping protein FliD n=1 Tax=Erythrobacter sp. KY5 TaxID=2011159 RepID=UPI000DBF25C7|nr:flagellar filament capping protein FliD [Erythrobacter sp. KY5]AWW73573.1 flagellar hook protein [Erythrobacter sp. KY5]